MVSDDHEPQATPRIPSISRNFVTRLLPAGSRTTALLLSVREVAAQLGVCTATVYRLFDRGELPHVRILDSLRVAPDDLRGFIEARLKNALR